MAYSPETHSTLFRDSSYQKFLEFAEHAKAAEEHAAKAAEHSKRAIIIWEELNIARGNVAPKASRESGSRFQRNGTESKTRIFPTMKRNCDLAYQIFLECKTPLHKDDLLKRMRATGKTNLTKASSLAYYIRLDDRFEKAGHGLWYIKEGAALL